MHKSRYQSLSSAATWGLRTSVAWFEKTYLMLADKERPTEVVLGAAVAREARVKAKTPTV